MKFKQFYAVLLLLIITVSYISCSSSNGDGEEVPKLTVSETTYTFQPEGGELNMMIATNNEWSIANAASWLELSQSTGKSGEFTIALKAKDNGTGNSRSTIVIITSSNGQARRLTVTQTGNLYPSYNLSPKTADATGMSSTAKELTAKIKLGINLGNTLELKGVNADPTEANIKFIKQMGFNAVRLPCGWDYVGGGKESSAAKIDPAYISKVKQVVQWCVENDLYVLVNIHWDGGWLERNVTATKQESVNEKQKAFWEQIATSLRDFDEHLLFASANEPDSGNVAEMAILLTYHKTFVKAVRSTGGRNTYRTLVIQGHTEHIKSTDFATLNDPTPNRLAFEWHSYNPSSFTILDNDKVNGGWDDVRFYWGQGNHSAIESNRNCSYGEEAELLTEYTKIKTNFIDKGIPCIMGEYSSQRWSASNNKFVPKEMDKHNKSVDDWYIFNTKQCKVIGGAPFIWDTGGLFDRGTNTVKDQKTLDAIKAGLQ
jgi:endoglucanase